MVPGGSCGISAWFLLVFGIECMVRLSSCEIGVWFLFVLAYWCMVLHGSYGMVPLTYLDLITLISLDVIVWFYSVLCSLVYNSPLEFTISHLRILLYDDPSMVPFTIPLLWYTASYFALVQIYKVFGLVPTTCIC